MKDAYLVPVSWHGGRVVPAKKSFKRRFLLFFFFFAKPATMSVMVQDWYLMAWVPCVILGIMVPWACCKDTKKRLEQRSAQVLAGAGAGGEGGEGGEALEGDEFR